MKTIFAVLLLLAFASTSYASDGDQTVRWQSIKGVITAPGIDNPVAGISAGTLPWTTQDGRASVNLATGAASFEVTWLVLNGGPSGTTGPVQQVTGTLVCNPGARNQAVLDTPAVSLSQQGNAYFNGNIGTVPAPCDNPLFLIRIANLGAASGRWIATGAVRSFKRD